MFTKSSALALIALSATAIKIESENSHLLATVGAIQNDTTATVDSTEVSDELEDAVVDALVESIEEDETEDQTEEVSDELVDAVVDAVVESIEEEATEDQTEVDPDVTVIYPEDYEEDDEPTTEELIDDATDLGGDPYGNQVFAEGSTEGGDESDTNIVGDTSVSGDEVVAVIDSGAGEDDLGTPTEIEINGDTKYLDPYAQMLEDGVYTRDGSAYVDPAGLVYAWDPYAFFDPRDGKVYALQLDAILMEDADGNEKIYLPSSNAYVDPNDGYAYTIDPEAISMGSDGVYTSSGPEPIPSFPELDYEFVNPIEDALENVQISGADVISIDGEDYVIYDP